MGETYLLMEESVASYLPPEGAPPMLSALLEARRRRLGDAKP